MSHSFARTLQRTGAQRVLTDRALANLAAEGNDHAADALLARHQEAMCRVVAGVVGTGPAAAAAASAALASARSALAAGLPQGHPPRLSLLGAAYSCAAGAGPPQGDAAGADIAELPAPERAALVLTATVGLSVAAAAQVMGTTDEHVGALVAGAEADLTAFPTAGPECLDARSEIPPAGALAAHAGSCPPCSAFAVERAERSRRLAAVPPVAPAAALAGETTEAVAGVAVGLRRLPRAEMAVLGTVGAAVVTVGITLGAVLTTTPPLEVPAPSADDLRPRTVPKFPEVASGEKVRLVTRFATPGASRPVTARVRFGVAPLISPATSGATPPSPQPPPPSGVVQTPDPPRPDVVDTPRPRSVPDVAVETPSPAPSPPRAGAPVASGPRTGRRSAPVKRTTLPPAVTPARVVVPPAPPAAPAAIPPAPEAPQAAPPAPSPMPPGRGRDHGDDHDDDNGYDDTHAEDRDNEGRDHKDGDDPSYGDHRGDRDGG